jgi:hypothetical protein
LLTGDEELDPEIWSFGSVDQKSEGKKNGKRKSTRNSKEAKRAKRSRAEERDANEDEKKEEPHPPSPRPASRAARKAIRIAMMSDIRRETLEPMTFLGRKSPKEAERTKRSRSKECDNNVEEQKEEPRPPSTRAASKAARSAIRATVMSDQGSDCVRPRKVRRPARVRLARSKFQALLSEFDRVLQVSKWPV